MQLVIVRSQNGIGELLLNRPAQRNSLTGPLVDELTTGLKQLQEDDSCKCIIIRGEGGYFCAGLDLKAFSQEPAPAWKAEFTDKWQGFHKRMFEGNKPTIAAVEKFAIAGGSSLAFACDFIVMGESAFIHVAEVERGMLAPLNCFWLGLRYGYQTSLEMTLVGERRYAEELKGLGITHRIVKDDAVIAEAQNLAARFASFDATNTQRLKSAIRSGASGGNFEHLLAKVKTAAR